MSYYNPSIISVLFVKLALKLAKDFLCEGAVERSTSTKKEATVRGSKCCSYLVPTAISAAQLNLFWNNCLGIRQEAKGHKRNSHAQ